jgi:large subunit ribosomal protein L4
MPVLDVYNAGREKVSEVTLSDQIFNVEVKEHLIHEAVVAQLKSRRRGTASTKNRAKVRGGGVKPWRQKGTGRARAGTIRSPIWVGGGVVFGPTPKSFKVLFPKKKRRVALKSALTLKLKKDNIMILDKLEFEEIKTKRLVSLLDNLGMTNVLIITGENNLNLEKSAMNIKKVKILKPEGLNVYDILKYEKLVLTESAIQGIEKVLLP